MAGKEGILTSNLEKFIAKRDKIIEDLLPESYHANDIVCNHYHQNGIKEYYYKGKPIIQFFPEKWECIHKENSRVLCITQKYRVTK